MNRHILGETTGKVMAEHDDGPLMRVPMGAAERFRSALQIRSG